MKPIFRALLFVISRLDGKPGLSWGDFAVIVDTVVSIDRAVTGGTVKKSNVVETIVARFGSSLPDWLPGFVSDLAYVYARVTGQIEREPQKG